MESLNIARFKLYFISSLFLYYKSSGDSLDWKDITTEQIVDRVTRNVKPGSIVLFHNNAEHVEDYLPSILSKLQSEGYKIVPVGQLIMTDNYHMDHAGKQMAD